MQNVAKRTYREQIWPILISDHGEKGSKRESARCCPGVSGSNDIERQLSAETDR